MTNPSLPRIISASRRTDIPAFYTRWFINRLRAGYCLVPNPFNPRQVSRVSLRPEDVDGIVFWTRNPAPLLPYLDELDRGGYRYYFQYTLMDYPRLLEAKTPPAASAIRTFRKLAQRVGPQRVIWRYNPLVFTPRTDAGFHRRSFERLAAALAGSTRRVVISVMDAYPKIAGRMRRAAGELGDVQPVGAPLPGWFADLIAGMAQTAAFHGMEMVSCAERLDLEPLGVRPGRCVDGELFERLFGAAVGGGKDPSQRAACGCIPSKDIGAYDTCRLGCAYCYATRNFELAERKARRHDPASPALAGEVGDRDEGGRLPQAGKAGE